MPAATTRARGSARPVNKPSTATQKGIQQFARVSKATLPASESKKRKAVSQDIEPAAELTKPSPRKKQVLQRSTSQNVAETPTRGASRLLAGLELSKPVKPLKLTPIAEKSKPTKDTSSTDQLAKAPAPKTSKTKVEKNADADLPEELQQLVSLHSSFLTALSLYYAHNGTATPPDVRTLTPSITKIWGKRKVTLDDIKRSVAMMSHRSAKSKSSLHLSNYGRGKICLELQQTQKRGKRSNGALVQPINEKEMNASFAAEIDQRWREWSADTPQNENTDSVCDFMAQLPLAEVTECASLAKAAPLLAKGQRRLEDLKAGAIKAQQKTSIPTPAKAKAEKNNAPKETPSATENAASNSDDDSGASDKENAKPSRPAPAAASRATSLLDRILAKQQAAATAPAPPSAAEQARLSALHRCEDILAILSLLATSSTVNTRVAFPLPRLVRDVQTSSRSPISADEVRKVVEVLADEITPGHVSFMRLGGLEAVVVDRTRSVGSAEVKRRVTAAGAKNE